MFPVLTSEVVYFADNTGSGSRDLRCLDDFLRRHRFIRRGKGL